MAALSLANFTDFVERKYIASNEILKQLLESTPFLGVIKKDETLGDKAEVPINYAAPAGVSSDYAVAVAGQTPGKYGAFEVQPKQIYGYGKVSNIAIRAADANQNKVLKLKPLTNEMDKLIMALKLQVGSNVMGNHGMALGQAFATPGGTDYTLFLKNPYDHFKLHLGQQIVASVTDGTSGALRDADHCLITGITRGTTGVLGTDTAKLTTDTGYWTTIITGLVANDYLFLKGSFGTGVYGMDSWVPTDRSILGTAFCGVTRSADAEQLAGWYFANNGGPIEEAINNAVAAASVGGCRPTVMFINPMDQAAVLNAYKGATRPNTIMAQGNGQIAKIGYKGVEIDSINGPITVISDRFCRKGYLRLITPDSWTFLSAKKPFELMPLDSNGSTFRVTPAGEDSTEFTVVGQIQVTCNAPGQNAVIYIG